MFDSEDEEEINETLGQEQQFFILGGSLFSIAFIFIAFGVGWLLGVSPLQHLNWNWTDLFIGIGAAMPMFLFFLISVRVPIQSFQKIKQFLLAELGPRIEHGSILELFILSIFIGLGEEMLFRGVLQSWASQYGILAAIIFTNFLFGIVHSVTRLYVVIATLMGVYLSLLLIFFSPQNLLIPITTHTIYDFLCFVYILRLYRQQVITENSEV
ncbi:MAG: CPBP family intramembrane metalloprotease [Planctomycetes bacterium]|nr:CPBP family intramembrane metalloprotease [Planctomycetota bacterium]MCH9725971.1 CPBP family intramembrane metalloprotease [Planctomycetota bacterium]MCH9777124.1 CPBP family intramembrane metalloprotease [Planctomycetota bacterium]MCH9790896.1 CPBP family intramembrane metalloprotease [Planctomycetota bacterium]